MIYWFLTCGFAACAVLLALFEQLGVPQTWVGYGFAGLAFAFCVFSSRLEQTSATAGRASSALRGMAAAGGWLSAAAFIGLGGALFLHGYDGLAFLLGLAGGLVAATILVAPHLDRSGAATVSEFLAVRYGGVAPSALATLVLACCALLYLTAQISAIALIGERYLALSFESALSVAFGATLLCALARHLEGGVRAQAALYTIAFLAFLAPVAILSARHYGLPVPELTFGHALGDLTSLELGMLKKRLADARTLKPHLQPFLSFDRWNFFGLIFCLALGTAAVPRLVQLSPPVPQGHEAHRSAAWSLFFVFLFCFTVPAYAAFAKLEVYRSIDAGTPLSALPNWIYAYGKLGLIKICGSAALDPATVGAACAKIGGHRGVLRHADLTMDPDAVVLAAPEIAGLPFAVAGLVAAGGLVVALGAAGATVSILSQEGSSAVGRSFAGAARSPALSNAILVLAGILAALLASRRPADILTMVAWALSLAAAGLFPAVVLGIWWRRANALGAALGIASGFAVTFYYLIGTRYFAPSFFETWSALSNASPAAVARYWTLKKAWMSASAEAQPAAWAALDAHALSLANWWGTRSTASGLLGLPVGFVATFLGSILSSKKLESRPCANGPPYESRRSGEVER